MLYLFALITSAASGGGLDTSAIMVAAVSVLGTLGASYLMFRGKTQDTANWLIVELRKEAKDARQAAFDCEIKRSEDRKILDELRSLVAGLQGGLRRLTAENKQLKRKIHELELELHAQIDHGE